MGKVSDVVSKNSRTLIGLEFRPSLVQNRISYVENGVNYPIGGTFKSLLETPFLNDDGGQFWQIHLQIRMLDF